MSNSNDYKQLLDDAKSYLNTRYDLLRLELLDKLSTVIGMLLLSIVLILLVFAVLAYCSVALVSLLAQALPLPAACCIIAAAIAAFAVAIYLLRDKLFINPLIRFLSSVLYKESDTDETKKEADNGTN